MNFLFTAIIFLALLIFIEIVKKIFSLPGEYSRKIAHITSAIIIFFLPYFLSKWQIILLASLFVLLLSLSKRLNVLKSLHSVTRKTWGEIFLPAGVGVAALLFLPDNLIAFQFGILVMGFSDGLAGILGERFGKRLLNFFGVDKTYFGSIVFFFATIFIFLFFTEFSLHSITAAILVTALLTITEALLKYGIDNIVLPVLAGYLLLFFL